MYYADETVIISTDNTWSPAQEKICAYLNHVTKWLAQNKLSLNVDKTVYMTLGNYCDSVLNTLNIKIGTQLIKRVECHKYVGLHFDYNMKWDKQIKERGSARKASICPM